MAQNHLPLSVDASLRIPDDICFIYRFSTCSGCLNPLCKLRDMEHGERSEAVLKVRRVDVAADTFLAFIPECDADYSSVTEPELLPVVRINKADSFR